MQNDNTVDEPFDSEKYAHVRAQLAKRAWPVISDVCEMNSFRPDAVRTAIFLGFMDFLAQCLISVSVWAHRLPTEGNEAQRRMLQQTCLRSFETFGVVFRENLED
ncbi:MAG: hypothetical protein DSY80_04955, partial [Desulfocapsa sp.]